MLVLSNVFNGKPVASFQSAHKVGDLEDPIIDPKNLHIAAFYVSAPVLGSNLVLHSEDIRNISPQGVIIDDNDQLMTLDGDLVRLSEVAKIDFKLMGKPVYTENNKKLGKVIDYVVETDDFMIMKIHVDRSIAKSFGSSQLIVDRSQIVKVTDDRIVVKSTAVKSKASVKEIFFGKSLRLEPDQIKSDIKQD